MRILGVSAFHRDAAAALLVDGRPVAALREAAFSGRLHDGSFPIRAARACLAQAGLEGRDLDRVALDQRPLRELGRIVAAWLAALPRSWRTLGRGEWLGARPWTRGRIARELELDDPTRVVFTSHPLAHAASAFITSPFEEAAVLVLDDAGERATATLARGTPAGLEVLGQVRFPHSLGLLQSAITQYLGLAPGADEPLVESLAARGTPRFMDELARLVRPGRAGSFTLDESYLRFGFDGERLFSPRLEELLGPARGAGTPLRYVDGHSRDADVAASLQQVLEERALALAEELHRRVRTRRRREPRSGRLPRRAAPQARRRCRQTSRCLTPTLCAARPRSPSSVASESPGHPRSWVGSPWPGWPSASPRAPGAGARSSAGARRRRSARGRSAAPRCSVRSAPTRSRTRSRPGAGQ